MKQKITLVIIGVIKKSNKFLLTFRNEKTRVDSWANLHWQFPGGGIEFGETPEQTIIREMKEELGIDITILKLSPNIITQRRNNWQGLLICYLCKYDSKQKITLNDEASNFGWFTLQEIKKLKTLPGAYEIAASADERS